MGKTRPCEFFQIYTPISFIWQPILSAQGDLHGEIPENRFFVITFDWSVLWTSGTTSEQKKRFNSGIARISQPPPHPPIRATLPTLSAVATIDETFSLSKKRAQKNSGKGKPPPKFGQCPN